MSKHYDFSQGKKGAVAAVIANKERITIRLDADIIEWFKRQVNEQGGGNYQTLINNSLRHYIDSQAESLEKILRRIIREELHKKAD